jgi:hypothetical protein
LKIHIFNIPTPYLHRGAFQPQSGLKILLAGGGERTKVSGRGEDLL